MTVAGAARRLPLFALAVVSIQAPSGEVVRIAPGESIQAAVDAHTDGTTFVLLRGTHRGQSVRPRDGNAFVGEPGAIMDGEGGTRDAFHGLARDVVIRTLIIEQYANEAQHGAIHAGGGTRSELSSGWVVEHNEIRFNDGTGVRTGDRIRIVGNHIHHNGQLGVGGLGDNILVEDNEIAHNNPDRRFDYGWEAGGTKFVKTRSLVVRGNHSHHNWGPGLWTDIDAINTLYEGNLVEDNADSGIFHEISYSAVIRNNTVRRNGFDRDGEWAYGAGILVAHSPDVMVLDNVLEHNRNGVIGIQQQRGAGAHGPHQLENLTVLRNRIVQRAGWAAGVAQDVGRRDIFRRNIRFEQNTYVLDDAEFAWNDGSRSARVWAALAATGNETFVDR